jgi:hypothetical protein
MRSIATQNFCLKSVKATEREHASINADTEPAWDAEGVQDNAPVDYADNGRGNFIFSF